MKLCNGVETEVTKFQIESLKAKIESLEIVNKELNEILKATQARNKEYWKENIQLRQRYETAMMQVEELKNEIHFINHG